MGLHSIDISTHTAKTFDRYEYPDAMYSDGIYTLYVNKQSQVFVGTINGGTSIYDPQKQTFSKNLFLSNEKNISVSCFFEDSTDKLWIGTHTKGVFLTGQDNNALRRRTIPEAGGLLLSDKSVSSLLCDKNGDLWAGTDGDGLYVCRLGSQKYIPIDESTGLTSKVILDIDEMPDGTIWLATWGDGIAIYDPAKASVRYENSSKKNSLKSDNIKSVNFDGHLCWISSHGGGVEIYDWDKQSFVSGTFAGLSESDRRLPLWGNTSLIDTKGNVWFGTTIGLYKYDGKAMHSYLFSAEDSATVPSNYISDIHCDRAGTVWVGTLGGLCKYIPAKNNFDRSRELLLKSPIYSILRGNDDTLLITTPASFIKYMDGTRALAIFTSLDNMFINNFTERSKSIDSSGIIHLGGLGAILSIDSKRLKKNNKITLLLSSLYLNNTLIDPNTPNRYLQKQIFLADTLRIDYTKSQLRIDYICLDPMGEPNLMYRYKLKGFDKVWNNAGRQTAALYSNLPYGDYSFVVQVIDEQGTVLGENRHIRIEILPPWWATLSFKIAIALLSILAVIGILLLRLQILTKRKKKLEAEVARRTSQLLASHEQLSHDQQLLLDQNDELQESNEMSAMRMHALRESLKTKDQLIAIIAHDLKNPIGAASGMLSLLGGFFESGNKNKFVKFQSHIQNSMTSMQNLVDSMTDWSLCEAGQLKYIPSEINLDQTFREVLSLVSPSAERKNIQLIYRNELKRHTDTDPRMIATILRNLIQNAIKFTPTNGIISILAKENGEMAECTVSDSGMGMLPDLCEALVTGKTIIPSAGTANEKGIGLGLQTCRKFIAFCKGEFRIESELGKGSIFSFTVPLSNVTINAHDASISQNTDFEETQPDEKIITQHYIPRLIIVDDNPHILELLSESFQDGYEVFVFENPERALICAIQIIPDIILSDILMPQMSGTVFCQSIKSNRLTKHIPLIFLTSQTSNKAEISGLDAEADDYMTKPFDIGILKAKIQTLLTNRKRVRASIENGDITGVKELNDPFMIEFHKIITDNINNYKLSVEFIADKMQYSKSQIYRKCHALTGIAPAEYILENKLNMATQLLQTNDKPMSEIAFDLGFSDPQYFSKVFVAKFGVSPKKYRDSL